MEESHMKGWLFILMFFLRCLPLAVYSLDVPRLQSYVNDYAGMISPSAKSKIEEELRAFEQSDSTQIVILTVPSLEGGNIEEFGIKVAEVWKVGQQGKDNGVLFLVSKQERKIRIEVGRGLEGKLTDLMAGRIIDQVIAPRFKRADFDGGFAAGVSAFIDATRGEFKAEQRAVQQRQRGFPPFLTFLPVFCYLCTLFLGSLLPSLGGFAGAIGASALFHLAAFLVGIPSIVFLALVRFCWRFFICHASFLQEVLKGVAAGIIMAVGFSMDQGWVVTLGRGRWFQRRRRFLRGRRWLLRRGRGLRRLVMRGHSKADKFFTAEEKERLKATTHEVESRTIGEIVVMVVDQSDHYIEAEVLGSVLLGSLLSLILTVLFIHSTWSYIPLSFHILFSLLVSLYKSRGIEKTLHRNQKKRRNGQAKG